jgi:transposase
LQSSGGAESGPLKPWLVHELRALDVPVVCLDARHAKVALSMPINKTDANDADGLGQIVSTSCADARHNPMQYAMGNLCLSEN